MTKITAAGVSLAIVSGAAALMAVNASAQVSWEQHGSQVDSTSQSPTPQGPAPQGPAPQGPAPQSPTPQTNAATEPTINCFNAQSLKASLDQMIAPMSRMEQKSFMVGFFHYVYASRRLRHAGYGGVIIWGQHGPGDLAVFSADGFLNDGRMDDLSPVRAYTTYNRSTGHSTNASYNRFLDRYCPNVEGMNRAKLTALDQDERCLESLAKHQESRGIFGRRRLAEGCELPVMPIGT